MLTDAPHAHLITQSSYLGWIFSFIFFHLTKFFHWSLTVISQVLPYSAILNGRFFKQRKLQTMQQKNAEPIKNHHILYYITQITTCQYLFNKKLQIGSEINGVLIKFNRVFHIVICNSRYITGIVIITYNIK